MIRRQRTGKRECYSPRAALRMLALVSSCLALSCQSSPRAVVAACEPAVVDGIDVDVYQRAQSGRATALTRENELLRADLQAAEEALIAAESGLRGRHSHADAVSALAAARIEVERAARRAPWRTQAIAEAVGKLADARAQVQEGHFGAALFFVYRARRVAAALQLEAEKIESTPDLRFITNSRVNLHMGPSVTDGVREVLTRGTLVFPERADLGWTLVRAPSGSAGWVHSSLLSPHMPTGDAAPASPE